jgi:putative glutathione S-transferase
VPGVAGTVNLHHIKAHYYGSHQMINPTRIVPVGPELNYAAPHDRARFGKVAA